MVMFERKLQGARREEKTELIMICEMKLQGARGEEKRELMMIIEMKLQGAREEGKMGHFGISEIISNEV